MCVLVLSTNGENNWTEETGLITPSPGKDPSGGPGERITKLSNVTKIYYHGMSTIV